MFDIKQNLVLNVGNSWCNMIRNQSHRFSGLNPNVLHHGESSRLVFLLPVASVIATIDNSLNRLDATKRQGETNNRVNNPRSGKLADFHKIACNFGDCTSKLSNRATSYAECS